MGLSVKGKLDGILAGRTGKLRLSLRGRVLDPQLAVHLVNGRGIVGPYQLAHQLREGQRPEGDGAADEVRHGAVRLQAGERVGGLVEAGIDILARGHPLALAGSALALAGLAVVASLAG